MNKIIQFGADKIVKECKLSKPLTKIHSHETCLHFRRLCHFRPHPCNVILLRTDPCYYYSPQITCHFQYDGFSVYPCPADRVTKLGRVKPTSWEIHMMGIISKTLGLNDKCVIDIHVVMGFVITSSLGNTSKSRPISNDGLKNQFFKEILELRNRSCVCLWLVVNGYNFRKNV